MDYQTSYLPSTNKLPIFQVTSLFFIVVGSSLQFMDYRILEYVVPKLRLLIVGYYPTDINAFFSLRTLHKFINENRSSFSKLPRSMEINCCYCKWFNYGACAQCTQ